MAFTFDPTTDRGKVRLLIQDDDETYEFYTNAKIDAFLVLGEDCEGNTVLHAAALALDAWASNQVMILKVTTHMDLAVDGASVAREMRALADTYRKQAVAATTDSGFEIAELGLGHWSWIEQVTNEALND